MRIKNIDWIPFLTTRLVDDVASHIRLFKKAKFAEKTQESNGGKIVDLKSLFFDAEVAMETNLCRDLASSIQQEELDYLQRIYEILLFLLLNTIKLQNANNVGMIFFGFIFLLKYRSI